MLIQTSIAIRTEIDEAGTRPGRLALPPTVRAVVYIYTQLVKWCILEASDARVDCKIYCERYQSSLCLDFCCDRAPAVVASAIVNHIYNRSVMFVGIAEKRKCLNV